MLRKTGVGFFLILVFVLFAYSSAVADTPVFKSNDGKLYGSINVGVAILNDIDFSAAASGGGVTVTAAGSYSFDTAASFGGALGYVINDFVRTELELGYQKIDYDKINITGDVTYGATTVSYTGEADLKGDIDALHFLTNVILTPLGNKTLFGTSVTPLVGAGIGFLSTESKITSIGTQATNSETSATDFLVSIMTGLEYASSQQVTWAIKYRHSWVDSGKDGAEDAAIDSIGANVNIAF
jgi:opacity protein-like surface antigen